MTDSSHKRGERPEVVDHLDIDRLHRGRITRLLVELAHDGLGAPIHVPMLVARGERPGPVFGITAGVHGNELNGIPVIHRLFGELTPARLRGTVAAVVVVNVPGYLANQRRFIDGKDLNHIMPGLADGSMAKVFVHRFIDRVVRRFEFLVDMHTASFGNINSLYVRADLTDTKAARMARLLRPQIILNNPPSDRTLRGTASEMSIPAITVEVGNPQRFKPEFIRSSLLGIRRILAEIGMVRRRPHVETPPPILCSDSRWLYTDHGGLLEVFPDPTERVQAGQVIARLSDVFGETVREYTAPLDGVVIGKRVNPVAQTGARIVHLGIEAEPGAYRIPKSIHGSLGQNPEM